jgi:hypothetical protein
LRAAVSAYLFQMSPISSLSCVVIRESTRAFAIFNAAISEDPELTHRRRLSQLCGSRDHGNAPGIENDDVVGDVENQLRFCSTSTIDRPFPSICNRGHHLGDDLRASPSDGSSINNTRGLPISAPDRQHLLLAAGQMRSDLIAAPETREHSEHVSMVHACLLPDLVCERRQPGSPAPSGLKMRRPAVQGHAAGGDHLW